VEVRVQPSLVSKHHILANVNGVFNALAVYGDVVGETLYYGSGAGQDATSSSVISDLADAADNLLNEAGTNNGFVPTGLYGDCLPVEETVSRYYLRLRVADVPGVVAQLASVLAEHDIGISSMVQPQSNDAAETNLMLMLHDAPFGKMQSACHRLSALSCVKTTPVLLRVETLPSS
jgi:homoserine dehydrogenase